MYENDPNRPRDPVRTPNQFDRASTSGYGWLPIAVVAALLLAVFMLIPRNDPRAPSVTERTGIDRPATPTPPTMPPANNPAPPANPSPPAAPTIPPQ
jgi:hypothetical protein